MVNNIHNNEEFIIVFGSGSNRIPKIKATEIYSSNGSAELAELYKRKYLNVHHTCVVAARSFLKLDHVKPRVVKANPEKILVRDYEEESYKLVKNLFNEDVVFESFTRKEQFYFQKSFFKLGLFDLFAAELFYERVMLKKINHFFKFLVSDDFLGVSSGFFAILHALNKHPDKKILVSGISFTGGNHYYKSGMMSFNRGRVDGYLVNKLNDKTKDKIFILDKNISEKFGLNFIHTEILN